MSSLFDWAESDRRKQEGIDRIREHYPDVGFQLHWCISHVLKFQDTVTSDDVYAIYGPLPLGVHKNVMGAAFRSHPSIRKTGQVVQSKRPEAHARNILVWVRK